MGRYQYGAGFDRETDDLGEAIRGEVAWLRESDDPMDMGVVLENGRETAALIFRPDDPVDWSLWQREHAGSVIAQPLDWDEPYPYDRMTRGGKAFDG